MIGFVPAVPDGMKAGKVDSDGLGSWLYVMWLSDELLLIQYEAVGPLSPTRDIPDLPQLRSQNVVTGVVDVLNPAYGKVHSTDSRTIRMFARFEIARSVPPVKLEVDCPFRGAIELEVEVHPPPTW